jgi:hypothetical protein
LSLLSQPLLKALARPFPSFCQYLRFQLFE